MGVITGRKFQAVTIRVVKINRAEDAMIDGAFDLYTLGGQVFPPNRQHRI
jgi:hypothetical protein